MKEFGILLMLFLFVMIIEYPKEIGEPIGKFINWIEVNDYDQYLSYKSYKEHNR